MKSLVLLGATGSIGQATLAVVRDHPSRLTIRALIAGNNAAALATIAREFSPRVVAIADAGQAEKLERLLRGEACAILSGAEGVCQAVSQSEAEMCVSAIVGSAGLRPTLAAIEAGMDVALANKETLVAAGELVMERVREKGVRLLPVDSEHSALYQCLENRPAATVRKLIITASGGPFRDKTAADLAAVTPQQALAHPTWEMGPKITIDSATLANKALEIIEAHWLFGLPYDRIEVLVHPQSVVHGLVEFTDGAMLAQLAVPDMRVPIQYALSYPERWDAPVAAPNLAKIATMTFAEPDNEAFPMLELGRRAGREGGTSPAVFSAANEEAVRLFLEQRIGFLDIPKAVRGAMEKVPVAPAASLEVILAAERQAREAVHNSI